MAVDLNFNIYQDSNNSELVFEDLTGTYSASNTGGWGAPNELLSSVTSWSITITIPSNSTPIIISDPAGVPSNVNGTTTILPTTLGYTNSNIEDGVFEVTYEVITNTTTYRKTLRFCLYGNVQCCVKRMALQLKPNYCCNNKFVDNLLFANSCFCSLVNNADFGNETAFLSWLSKLQKICAFNNCNCN